MRFLSTNTGAWQAVRVPAADAADNSPIRLGGFVEAAVEAARTLRLEELHAGLGVRMAGLLPEEEEEVAEEAVAEEKVEAEGEATAASAAAEAEGLPAAAAPPVAAARRSSGALTRAGLPARPSEEAVAAALALMREVAEVLKATVKPDTIMVLPGLPFPPPKRIADTVSGRMGEAYRKGPQGGGEHGHDDGRGGEA